MKLHLPVKLLRAVMALFVTSATFASAWAQEDAPSDVTYGSGEGENGSVVSGDVGAYGGAIFSNEDVIFNDDNQNYGNGVVEFIGYCALSESHASGGAIYTLGDVIVSNNDGEVKFNENKAHSTGAVAEGGAITSATGIVSITANAAGVEVKGNSVEAHYNAMGAIYAGQTIEVQGNGKVTIAGNSATEKSEDNEAFKAASGGGLNAAVALDVSDNGAVVVEENSVASANGYAVAGGVGAMLVSLAGNDSLTFDSNTATGSRYAGGGAILSTGSLSISGNEGDVSFSGNNATSVSGTARGGAISADISPIVDVTWRDIYDWMKNNHGKPLPDEYAGLDSREKVEAALKAEVPNAIVIVDNGSVSFTNNSVITGEINEETGLVVKSSSDAHGGAVYSNGDVILSANDSLTFGGVDSESQSLGNSALSYGDRACGGAISAEANVIIGRYEEGEENLLGNGSVEFSNNSAASYGDDAKGGAIYSNSDVLIAGNTGAISFKDNMAESIDNEYVSQYHSGSAYGGAIYSEGNVSIKENLGTIEFSNNEAKAENWSQGGAIYALNTVEIIGTTTNRSEVLFSENKLTVTDEGGRGGAIYGAKGVLLSGNGDVKFCKNEIQGSTGTVTGGAISTVASNPANLNSVPAAVTITGNGNVTFDGNKAQTYEGGAHGGAIYGYCGFVQISNNENVDFLNSEISSGNNSETGGGAIYSEFGVSITGNNNVTFNSNDASSQGGNVYGGAINTDRGDIAINKNSNLTFSGNSITAVGSYLKAVTETDTERVFSQMTAGAAMASNQSVEINNNTGNITFSNNIVTETKVDDVLLSTGYDGSNENPNLPQMAGAGAIGAGNSLTMQGNGGYISFTENAVSSACKGVYGGAIATVAGVINISNNKIANPEDATSPVCGGVNFSQNSVIATGENCSAYGGALATYTDYYKGGQVVMSDNDSVTFYNNSVTAEKDKALGGAIYASNGVTLSNHENGVIFKGNGAAGLDAKGGAIYANRNLSIVNNGDVTFQGNYTKNGDTYQLNSVYVDGGNVELSAAAGSSISFYDSITVKSGSEVKLNSYSYTDAEGKTHTSTGSIVFSGATTEDDLKTAKNGVAGTDAEIAASRTSVIARDVSVAAGSLEVVDGAQLEMLSLTVDAGATLVLGAGSGITTTQDDVTFSEGSQLTVTVQAAAEASTFALNEASVPTASITADSVMLSDGMTYTMDGAHIELLGDNNTLALNTTDLAFAFNVDKNLAIDKGNQTLWFALFSGVENLTLNGNLIKDLNDSDIKFNLNISSESAQLVYEGNTLYVAAKVPEPTTATLSLLALAGLAARRRRK